jgi:hypothetical protein
MLASTVVLLSGLPLATAATAGANGVNVVCSSIE